MAEAVAGEELVWFWARLWARVFAARRAGAIDIAAVPVGGNRASRMTAITSGWIWAWAGQGRPPGRQVMIR